LPAKSSCCPPRQSATADGTEQKEQSASKHQRSEIDVVHYSRSWQRR